MHTYEYIRKKQEKNIRNSWKKVGRKTVFFKVILRGASGKRFKKNS